MVMIEAERFVGDEPSVETRYYLSSLDNDAGRLNRAARSHWGVENGLQFLKVRWWDEDRQWSLRPGLAALRDATLAALRRIRAFPRTSPSVPEPII